jgi:phosphoglycolate phosphatase
VRWLDTALVFWKRTPPKIQSGVEPPHSKKSDVMMTVILDLDGPLLDGRHRHYACYRHILLAHGCTPLELDDYWDMKRRRCDRRVQLAASGAEALYDTFLRSWLELIETPAFLALDRLQAGALDKLLHWREQGVRLVLATQRHNREALLRQLADLGLDRLFQPVVICDHAEGGAGKARRVAEVLGQPTGDRRLWVGDTEVDVEAARALGCPVWAVWCGLRTEAYLKSLAPDFVSWGVAEVDWDEDSAGRSGRRSGQ